MNRTPIIFLQQRDFGQKINVTFEFVTRNFLPLVKALVFIAGPSALLSGIAQGIYQSRLLSLPKTTDAMQNFTRYVALDYFFVAGFGIITYFLAYFTVSSFMVLYEEKGSSEDLTPGVVWQKVLENITTGIGTLFLSFLITLGFTLLLVIPGIYVGICLQFSLMVVIREGLPATSALKRSYKLIEGKWWSTFGLIIIMSVIAGIVSIIFQLPMLITTFMTALGFAKEMGNMKVFFIAFSAISMIGTTVVQGIVWVALAFQYYNLVEKSDGSSLRAEIDSLGTGE